MMLDRWPSHGAGSVRSCGGPALSVMFHFLCYQNAILSTYMILLHEKPQSDFYLINCLSNVPVSLQCRNRYLTICLCDHLFILDCLILYPIHSRALCIANSSTSLLDHQSPSIYCLVWMRVQFRSYTTNAQHMRTCVYYINI